MNQRACEIMRTQISLSQAMLKSNLEPMKDADGHTLSSHVAGEIVILYKCRAVVEGLRHDEKACCEELPIWSGYNLSTPAFMEPITRRVKFSCTPRVCNSFNLPYFNIGTKDHPKWIQVGRAGDINEARVCTDFNE